MGEAMSIDWSKQPLGVESDRAIAKWLRVSFSTVAASATGAESRRL